jgi:cysteinyl-tRNA synthetase
MDHKTMTESLLQAMLAIRVRAKDLHSQWLVDEIRASLEDLGYKVIDTHEGSNSVEYVGAKKIEEQRSRHE